MSLPDIHSATTDYERWLAAFTPLVAFDLQLKHQHLSASAFLFMRGTFYRWMQRWPIACPELQDVPRVLSVGDVHIENFGTWRDAEGRLIWGVNDFDEAFVLPYTQDLVRLAASALAAIGEDQMALTAKAACDAILEGYSAGMEAAGEPFVIDESHRWFVPMLRDEERDPVKFWSRLRHLPAASGIVPREAMDGMRALLPSPMLPCRIMTRTAGVGSLGRPRYVILAEWRGGPLAREAKALMPSACAWADLASGASTAAAVTYYATLLETAVRCRDPFVCTHGTWLIRRLAPDCSRIELASLSRIRDQEHLLNAMGRETANIHLATAPAAPAILRDLKKRKRKWLRAAAKEMLDTIAEDWNAWRSK